MNIQLKKVTQADADLIVKWRNENKEFFPDQPDFTVESQIRWYTCTHLFDPADNYFMVMADNLSVGTIALDVTSREIGRVMLGNKDYARKGVMGTALDKLVELYGFDSYYLKVLLDNAPAIKFYKKHRFFEYGDLDGYLCMERLVA